MHYKDGTEAKIGDQVKGVGYNIKDENGNPKEFFGTVIGLVPGQGACNIQVAHIIIVDDVIYPNTHLFNYTQNGVVGCGPEGHGGGRLCGAYLSVEYGSCESFEKIG